jgi:signal transduction histidine kinase
VILSAGLSAALLLCLWWTVDQTIRDTIDASLRDAVDVDLASLVDIHASGGDRELQARIADRLAVVPSDGNRAHYLLTTADGRKLAGDIGQWPALDPGISETGRIAIGAQSAAQARVTQLPGGLRLLVAHEPSERGPLLARVGLVFLVGGALFVACIALFAQTAASRVRQKVAGVGAAFRQGDDQALAVLAGASVSDEIDEIAGQAALALRRDRALMQAHRETSEQVAHEIRTPLSHLDARLAKTLSEVSDGPVAERLKEARDDIRRLVGTLEALLDIAAHKAQEGHRQALRPVNLSGMVARICDLYQDSAEEAGHAFAWEIAPAVLLPGEEAQLSRIVTNLLDNAFKYNRPGGAIHVTLQPGPILRVTDEGPGISPEDRDRVFERFYRGKATAGDQPGAGLGLALAQAIAHRHGLRIRVVPSDTGAHFVMEPEAP